MRSGVPIPIPLSLVFRKVRDVGVPQYIIYVLFFPFLEIGSSLRWTTSNVPVPRGSRMGLGSAVIRSDKGAGYPLLDCCMLAYQVLHHPMGWPE